MAAPVSPISVKVRRGEEMRRFPIDVPLAFAALAERVRTVFGVGARDTLVLKYQDNEGDLITVSTDLELAEALRLSGPLLRLELVVRPANAAAAAPKPAAKPAANKPAAAPTPSPPAKAAAAPAPVPKAAAAKSPSAPTALSVAATPTDSSNSTPTPASAVTPGGPAPQEPVRSASAVKAEPSAPLADPKAEKMADRQRRIAEREQMLLAREAEKEAKRLAKVEEVRKREEEKKEQLRRKMQEANEKGTTDAPEVYRELMKAEVERLKSELKAVKAEASGPPAGKALMWARFVRDVTVPDGTVLRPCETFIKTWRFRNELDRPWPVGTRLLFVGKNSDRLGAPDEVLIAQPLQAGAELDVSVPLVAPAAPGRYTAYFRLANADGKKFGQRVWVMVSVGSLSATAGNGSSGEEEEAAAATDSTAPAAAAADAATLAQYHAQLSVLGQLNFRNLAVNVRLLRRFNGSLEEVVSVLMRRRAAKRAAGAKGPVVATDSTPNPAVPDAKPAPPLAPALAAPAIASASLVLATKETPSGDAPAPVAAAALPLPPAPSAPRP